jgi:hypothetical protein
VKHRASSTVAAIIMSFYLLTTSFVTTVLIPAAEFHTGGSASSIEATQSTLDGTQPYGEQEIHSQIRRSSSLCATVSWRYLRSSSILRELEV